MGRLAGGLAQPQQGVSATGGGPKAQPVRPLDVAFGGKGDGARA